MLDQLLDGASDSLINTFIEEKAGDFLEGLVTKVGFSQEQAERFVPMAIRALAPIVKAKLSGDEDSTAKVDPEALAKEAGIDTGLAERGVAEIAPQLEAQLGEKLKESGLGSVADIAGGLLGGKGLGGLF